jgi:ferredoxin-NADP reductase
MAVIPWYTGTVIRIEDETYQTRRFFIKVNKPEAFNFTPGQYVTLDLPIHAQEDKRYRSYSISNWPDGTNVYELLIKLFDGGAASTYLFNDVKVGSTLKFRGAEGVFTLPENIDKDLYFICTGTGIAPFRSMLNYIHSYNVPHKNLYLVFGCRTRKDLLYHEEIKVLESKMENFSYIPILSREAWDGYKGYVHGAYEEICQKNDEAHDSVQNLRPALFYLSGCKAMINDARKKITELGYNFIE